MKYDDKLPSKLKKAQVWFGSIISRPIDEDSRMDPISPSGQPMEIEACDYIRPSPTLRPAQRIQIYNQQYWWRLLGTMHESFPMVTRLFGYHDFNRLIAIPYLDNYPPNHWSLNEIGSHLSKWVKEHYQESDQKLVYDAAAVDWSFNQSFCAKQYDPIAASDLPLEGMKLKLQPHIHLFELDYDLFTFRADFLKQEPEYWIENDFPELKKERTYYYTLFRNSDLDIQWMEITPAFYRLLEFLRKEASVDEACQWIEEQGGALMEEAAKHLQDWFQHAAAHRWLYAVKE